MKQSDKNLIDALIQHNVTTKQELEKHAGSAQKAREPLFEFLLSHQVITEKQALIALSQTYQLEMVNLDKVQIDPSILAKVPVKIAWYYKIMPLGYEQDVLIVVSALPLSMSAQDEIRVHMGCAIKNKLALHSQITESFKKHYGLAADTVEKILDKEPLGFQETSADSQGVEDLEKVSEDPTVANLVNQIILEAYKKRATDIHIEPYRDKVRFRYRIDGVLVEVNLPENVKHFLPAILSRIKIMANLSITEKRLPQDGSAVVKTKDQHLDLRVSTMPTPRGESMVIRILPTKVMLFSLEKLGFDEHGVKVFRELIEKPHGIIFMTGPTGSGKTTTLYACLNEINSDERKIITIEDPVEYEMEGITQSQVNTKVNFTFATGLRSLLRHDPDIIMVGEVRDLETAGIAIRTALTGHLVFSTLHTNDAASGVTRLIEMGVEPYLAASSVEAFVAQRLVRVICPQCKEVNKNPMMGIKEEIARSLSLPNVDDIKIYKGKGCDHCNHTGFYGRMAIYEILLMNDTIRTAVLTKPRSDYIKKIAMQDGMTTLRQNGWKAVISGITTPSEIMNVTTRDQYTDEQYSSPTDEPTGKSKSTNIYKELHVMGARKKGKWSHRNDYDSRIYARIYEPMEMRYRLVRRDPKQPNVLVYDGDEYPTLSQDISAGGLRFISKMMFPIGSLLELKIQLNKNQEISCLGRVCRVEENSLDNVYTIVVYYLDISSADRVAINRTVEQKLKDEENIQVGR